jgi:hypothetical protein
VADHRAQSVGVRMDGPLSGGVVSSALTLLWGPGQASQIWILASPAIQQPASQVLSSSPRILIFFLCPPLSQSTPPGWPQILARDEIFFFENLAQIMSTSVGTCVTGSRTSTDRGLCVHRHKPGASERAAQGTCNQVLLPSREVAGHHPQGLGREGGSSPICAANPARPPWPTSEKHVFWSKWASF